MSESSRRTAAKPSQKHDLDDAHRNFVEGPTVHEGACHPLEKKPQDVYSALLAIEAEAKEKLKAKCPMDLRFTLDDVLSTTKEATSCRAVLTHVLNSVRDI